MNELRCRTLLSGSARDIKTSASSDPIFYSPDVKLVHHYKNTHRGDRGSSAACSSRISSSAMWYIYKLSQQKQALLHSFCRFRHHNAPD